MATVKCFLLTPTDRVRRALRRYVGGHEGGQCSVNPAGYHNAETPIEDGPAIIGADGCCRTEPREWPRDDPRWPTHCICGYQFAEGDHWQLFYERVYVRSDTGEEVTLRNAPPGAIWEAPWMADVWKGHDGKCFYCMLPNGAGEWCIDGPATNGPGWERTGEAPNFTCTPSIGRLDKDNRWMYHGWLRNGELVDA